MLGFVSSASDFKLRPFQARTESLRGYEGLHFIKGRFSQSNYVAIERDLAAHVVTSSPSLKFCP